MKDAFLEIDKISSLKSHVDKLVNKNINNHVVTGSLEVDISYKDMEGNECFKSLPFEFDLELEGLQIKDVLLKSANVYVVDGRGVNVDYILKVHYDMQADKEVEIIEIKDEEVEVDTKPVEQPKKESKKAEAEIEKIKEDIEKDYETKLADSLKQRENKIAIVTTKNNGSELDFLRFFDDTVASYYSIKTLHCSSEEMLNTIAKEYKIPMDVLLKGYDRENGKVTFKLN